MYILQVHSDNSLIDLPLMELEKAEKGVKVAETVLAVSQDEKTNYGASCTIVLTSFRYALCVSTLPSLPQSCVVVFVCVCVCVQCNFEIN